MVLYWKILFRIKRISIEVWWEQTLTLQRMVAKTWQWIEFQEESEIFFLPQWIGRPSPELKTWREACAVVLRLVLVKGGNCHIWSLTIVGCLTKSSQHLIINQPLKCQQIFCTPPTRPSPPPPPRWSFSARSCWAQHRLFSDHNPAFSFTYLIWKSCNCLDVKEC